MSNLVRTNESVMLDTLASVTGKGISQGDILAIGIGKAEDALLTKREDLQLKHKKATDTIETLEKIFTKELEKFYSNRFLSTKDVEKKLKNIQKFSDKQLTISASYPNYTALAKGLGFSLSLEKVRDTVLTQKITISNKVEDNGYSNYSLVVSNIKVILDFTDKKNIPEFISDNNCAILDLVNTNEKLANEIAEVNRKLQELPRLQRNMQRAIAENILLQSSGGEALLDLINTQVSNLLNR